MSVNKTTVYLPDDLKRALGREAERRRTSEAELIRTAIADLVGAGEARPRPRFGKYRGQPMTVEDMDRALAEGFGER